MNTEEIKKAIDTLKKFQYSWADQIPNDGQAISDYEAYEQVIKSLEEYAD